MSSPKIPKFVMVDASGKITAVDAVEARNIINNCDALPDRVANLPLESNDNAVGARNINNSCNTLPDQVAESTLESNDTSFEEPKLLACGLHMGISYEKWSYLDDDQKKKFRYPRKLPRGDKRGSCLCDYTNYPELMDERLKEKARVAKTQELGGKKVENASGSAIESRLQTLPLELRRKIYKNVLALPSAVEFAPEPFNFEGRAPAGSDSRREFDEDWAPTRARHLKTIQQFSSVAKLLRVNKQIHKEATEFLFSENHFSFTNTSGWIALDWFLHKIPEKYHKHLHHITARYPDFTALPETLLGSSHFDKSIVGLKIPSLGSRKFYPSRWFDMGVPLEPLRELESIYLLRNLRLVVPFQHAISLEKLKWYASPLVDETKFHRLKITLVSHRPSHEGPLGQWDDDEDDVSFHDGLDRQVGGSLARSIAHEHNQNLVEKQKPWGFVEVQDSDDLPDDVE